MIIKSDILYSVLTEGRLEDVKSKYPGHEKGIDNLSQNDPSKNNKYLAWMTKMVFDQESPPKHVIDAVTYFHNNIVRFEQKDINQYKTLKDLIDAVETAKSKISKKEVKESGVEKIYEDENVMVIHPKTHAASCKYGSETKWCVTSKNNPTHFRDYSTEGPLFFFIDKRRLPSEHGLPRKIYWKVALHYSFYEILPPTGKVSKETYLSNLDKTMKMVHRQEYYNALDKYITKNTVQKYIPNLDTILESTRAYVLAEADRFYDLYKEWEKHSSLVTKLKKGEKSRIQPLSDELIGLIKLLHPETDISGIVNVINSQDWAELTRRKLAGVPTTRPFLKWYDVELDKKLDNERRKRT